MRRRLFFCDAGCSGIEWVYACSGNYVTYTLKDSEKYLKRWDDLQDKILDWAEEQGFDKETILEK